MVENQYALSKDELPILTELMDLLKLHPCFKGEAILKGRDPILASPHKLGESVANILLLNGVLASAIWELRTGEKNNLSLDIKDAIHFLHPSHFVWQQGYICTVRADIQPANTHFLCRDGRQVWLQNGPPYPKLESGYLNFFNCGNKREFIAKAISKWNSFELEEKLAEAGLPCVVVRTMEEWRAHPQGHLLLNTPVIEIEKIAEGKPYGLEKKGKSPLAGINVADLTHVLAGPRSTMGLAEYGASVLHIEPSYHTDPKSINLGVNHGKKSAFCNLDSTEDYKKLNTLLKEADVFAQSYRHTVMETDHYPERLTEDPEAFTFPPELRQENSPYGIITSLVPAVKFSNMPEIPMLPVVPFGASELKF